VIKAVGRVSGGQSCAKYVILHTRRHRLDGGHLVLALADVAARAEGASPAALRQFESAFEKVGMRRAAQVATRLGSPPAGADMIRGSPPSFVRA
jgi:hypothetical protein